jgi:methionyl-tRNA synthetase
VVSEPFIPASAAAMRAAFDLPGDDATWVTAEQATALTTVPAGTPFTVPPVLFAKITDEDLESYKERFGGEPTA